MAVTKEDALERWNPIANTLLTANFGKEEWWKETGGCESSSKAIPCDSKKHTRAFGYTMALQNYRDGHGWQPTKVYTSRPAGLGPLRHTYTQTGGVYPPGVFGKGGDTWVVATGKKAQTSPFWPEKGDFDQDNDEVATEEQLEVTRSVFALQMWKLSNDYGDLLKWWDSIKCEKKTPPCELHELGTQVKYAKSNVHAGIGIPCPHVNLAVCIIAAYRCTPPRTTTPPDRGKETPKTPVPPDSLPPSPPGTPKGPTTPKDKQQRQRSMGGEFSESVLFSEPEEWAVPLPWLNDFSGATPDSADPTGPDVQEQSGFFGPFSGWKELDWAREMQNGSDLRERDRSQPCGAHPCGPS